MKIDIGQISFLDIDTIVEAPNPEIYIGPALRPDPGPPTTPGLRKFLAQRESAGEHENS